MVRMELIMKDEPFDKYSFYNKPTCCKQCVHNPICKHPNDCPILEAEKRNKRKQGIRD